MHAAAPEALVSKATAVCEVVALSGHDMKARRPSEIQREASCRARLPSAGEDGWLIDEPCTT